MINFLILFLSIRGVIPSLIDERESLFPLAIIHINDFHARFEETNIYSGSCKAVGECIGGYARLVYKVKELLELRKNENAIYLDAGDNFQGTLWYNIGRWNVTKEFMNMLQADAVTIGNHEFDHGIAGLVPFLKELESPVVVANIDDSKEPSMENLYQKSIVIERSGRKIGIIGVILHTFPEIAITENLIFKDETESVKMEAEMLSAQGVDIIIVLSHCGYDVDQKIAKDVGPLIDIIVGAHTHTFLYTGTTPPGHDVPRGPYPTIVRQSNGHRVLIVQAMAFSKYVGDITLYFDENGEAVDYLANVHYLENSVPQDAEVLKALQPWKEIIDEAGADVVGVIGVALSNANCDRAECNLGDFYTDAIVDYYVKQLPEDSPYWTSAAIAMVNHDSLRIGLDVGNLTFSDLFAMSPFQNIIQTFTLPGSILKEVLEFAVQGETRHDELTSKELFRFNFRSPKMLQVSGLRLVVDISKPVGERLQSIEVRCKDCPVPVFEKFDPEKKYLIAANDYLANGGSGYKLIKDNKMDAVNGPLDLEMLMSYLDSHSPILTELDGRIQILGE